MKIELFPSEILAFRIKISYFRIKGRIFIHFALRDSSKLLQILLESFSVAKCYGSFSLWSLLRLALSQWLPRDPLHARTWRSAVHEASARRCSGSRGPHIWFDVNIYRVPKCNFCGLHMTSFIISAKPWQRLDSYDFRPDSNFCDLQSIVEWREERHLILTQTETRLGRVSIRLNSLGLHPYCKFTQKQHSFWYQTNTRCFQFQHAQTRTFHNTFTC